MNSRRRQPRPFAQWVTPRPRRRLPTSRQRSIAMLTRRHLIAVTAAQAFAPSVFLRSTRAQAPKAEFPSKPVRLIVPVAAGGPTDIVARLLGERLSTIWGEQVVVEN